MNLDIFISIFICVGLGLFFFYLLINPILKSFRLEKKLEKENKYGMHVKCANCSEYNTYFIPIGTSINDHLQGKNCRFCKTPMKKFIGDRYVE